MDAEMAIREAVFTAVRSSGAGGQHVNKVASKVSLSFSVRESRALNETEKERLLHVLGHRLSKEEILLLHCEESRSQHKNKELVSKRFLSLLKEALKIPKKRKKTRPGKAAVEKRLKGKREAGEKKQNRQKPDLP